MKNIINRLTNDLISGATEIDSKDRYSSHDADSIHYIAERKAKDVISRCEKFGTVTEYVNINFATYGFSGYFKTEQGILSVVTTSVTRGWSVSERTTCKLLKRIPKEVEKAFAEKAEAEKKAEAPKSRKTSTRKTAVKAPKTIDFNEFKRIAMEYMATAQDMIMLNNWSETEWNLYWKDKTEKAVREFYGKTLSYKAN